MSRVGPPQRILSGRPPAIEMWQEVYGMMGEARPRPPVRLLKLKEFLAERGRWTRRILDPGVNVPRLEWRRT